MKPEPPLPAKSCWKSTGAATNRSATAISSGSLTEIEGLTGSPCRHLSYPNGDYTDRETRLVQDAGYASARTTEIGWNGRDAVPLRLRIISLADFASVDVLAAHLAGLLAVRRLLPTLLHRRALRRRVPPT